MVHHLEAYCDKSVDCRMRFNGPLNLLVGGVNLAVHLVESKIF